MQPQAKQCPVCRMIASLDAQVCAQCGHVYRTRFEQPLNQTQAFNVYGGAYTSTPSTNRIAAGVCALLLGSLGIHKFILGRTGAGITMLLVSVLTLGIGAVIMHIIALIEGITYLSKSDAEFYQEYVLGQKAWF